MKNKKFSLFWGLIVTENIDFGNEKFISRFVIIVVIGFILYLLLNLIIKLYVVWG